MTSLDTAHLDREPPLVLANWESCPQCSSALFWEQGEPDALPNLRCASCTFMHFANPSPTVNCMVLDEHDRVLIVRRAHNPQAGRWCMPGGFIDAGEQPMDAAKRELMEEASVTATDWRCVNALLGWYNRERGQSTCNVCFTARIEPGQVPVAGSDATDVRWAELDGLDEILAFDNQREMLRQWRAEQA